MTRSSQQRESENNDDEARKGWCVHRREKEAGQSERERARGNTP